MKSSGGYTWLALTMMAAVALAQTPATNNNVGASGTVSVYSAAEPVTSDVAVYRALFRRTAHYKKLSDEAADQGVDKSHLRRILSEDLELDSATASRVEILAIDCQEEIAPIHDRVLAVIKEFRSKISRGEIKVADASAPPELAALQAEEDAVVIRHRDLLKNEMPAAEFLRMDYLLKKNSSSTWR
jgi:hypothetical protein